MKKTFGIFARTVSLVLFLVSLGTSSFTFAITPTALPASASPERATSSLATQPTENPQALPPLKQQANKPEAPSSLGPNAGEIKFKLTRIIIKNNHIYSTKQLFPLYKNKLNKVITVAELQSIVQDITNYYRNNGYVLSRALLPPQHVANGIVTIQIIEGYINHVKVIGNPKKAKALIEAYGSKIAQNRPLQVKNIEHYLLLANQIPGVQVKAVLEPSKTQTSASDLNLVTQTTILKGYISYDNYGTRYIGPAEITLGGELDSIFLSGDSTQFSYATTPRPKELKFGELIYNMPLGTEGTRLVFSGNRSYTKPLYVLTPIEVSGQATTYYAMLQQSILRSHTQNLTFDSTFNYIDSVVTQIGNNLLYIDHLRTLRLGGNYDLADSWGGSNSAALHLEQGLEILGATPVDRSTSGFTSEYGGSGHFTKFDMQLNRLQQITSRYSAFAIVKGQYALQPLLSTEQFSFGGAQAALGRGYDSGELTGDRGVGGSLELRMDIVPKKAFLQAMQLYVFYDAGVIWNTKNVPDQNIKQSATSTGIGSRFYFTQSLSGNLMIAQPLTRPVSALALIGDGRQPRIFFNLMASI